MISLDVGVLDNNNMELILMGCPKCSSKSSCLLEFVLLHGLHAQTSLRTRIEPSIAGTSNIALLVCCVMKV